MHPEQMAATHSDVHGNVDPALIIATNALYDCAQTCTSCADACRAEELVTQLHQCIRLNMDCADVCAATVRISNRRTGSDQEVIRRMLDACVTACRLCGLECDHHASQYEYCRICADSCRICEGACHEALRSI